MEMRWLTTVAWLARGVVYATAGLLALAVLGLPTAEDADQNGALRAVADLPAGPILLVLLVVGLLAFAVHEAIATAAVDRDGIEHLDRLGKAFGALWYTALAWSGITLLLERRSSGGGWSISELVSRVLRHDAGRAILVIAMAVVAFVVLRRLRRSLLGDLDDEIDPPDDPLLDRALRVSSRIGEAGRAVSLAIVGGFLVLATFRERGSEARSLDRALRAIADEPAGALAVIVVGVGSIVYGLHAIGSAPLRRPPTGDRPLAASGGS